MKHTPWIVEKFNGAWLVIDAAGFTVAELLRGKDNARLIAAAPDMLEACIYARDEMVVKTEGENYAYQALEAVIALATKESN